MAGLSSDSVLEKIRGRGVPQGVLNTIQNSGIDLHRWLHGFDCVKDSVRQSVGMIKSHPLLPKDLAVHGLLIHPETGHLDLLVNGYAPDNQE